MSVRDRVADAVLLWERGHHEGALLNVLVAVAACARKEWPNLGDRDAFVKFLEPRIVAESHVSIARIQYRENFWTPAELLYKWFRCQLVHEAELPFDVEFIDKGANVLFVQAGGAPRPPLRLSHAWFWVLVRSASVDSSGA